MDKVDKKVKKGTVCGQITVFLTLIFLILLSFVGTLVNIGRIHVLRTYSEGNLRLAVESIFTRYSRPLWEEYHLLFLEGEIGEEERIQNLIHHYMGEITGVFYKEKDVEFQVEEMIPFVGYEGEIYLNQMLEYMKFHLISKNLEKDFKMVEENKKAEATERVMEEKRQLDQHLSKTNRYVLEAIRLIEGITVTNGKAKAEGTFVKQLCPGEVSSALVGGSGSEFWEKLRGKYISPGEMTHGKANGILRTIQQALHVIEEIEKEEETQLKEISDFKIFYEKEKDNLVDGIGAVIETELGELGNYQAGINSPASMSSQVKRMKGVLLQNKGILETYLSGENEEEGVEILNTYNLSGLTFSYSYLNLKKQKSPVEAMDKLMTRNILPMVTGVETKLSQREIPPLLDFIQNSKKGETVLEGVLDNWMEVSYYQKHFNCYTQNQKKGMENLYQYEQEYIIAGGDTEKEALGSVVNRIFLTRLLFNYMYLLTDSEKNKEGYMAALAMVGFTGMEPLVSVTKHLILLNWARAEALVDISLLLAGEKIDLWKTSKSFLVTFTEMVGFRKEIIDKKVMEYKELEGIGKQGYEDYIRMYFLLTGKSERRNRSLQMIQENLRFHYYNDFSIAKGIFGMKITGKWNYGEKKTIIRRINYCY